MLDIYSREHKLCFNFLSLLDNPIGLFAIWSMIFYTDEGNPPVTGGFPSQRASNTENISIWWRHHVWIMHTVYTSLLFYHRLIYTKTSVILLVQRPLSHCSGNSVTTLKIWGTELVKGISKFKTKTTIQEYRTTKMMTSSFLYPRGISWFRIWVSTWCTTFSKKIGIKPV